MAVNLYKVRQANDAGGELFRSAQRQRDQYQGLWLLAPDGKVLAAHHEIKNPQTWTQEVQETLAEGLKAFGPVSARQAQATDPLPYRGAGVRPDGSVSLAVYVRYMAGGGRRLAPVSTNPASLWIWDGALRRDGPPVIDTLPLMAGEWAAFAPPKVAVGTEWNIPEAVARKFARALSPSSDQAWMPRPEEARVAELRATVESVEGGQARIRLAGRWATKHLYDGKASYGWASAEGIALYDTGRKALRSLLLTFHGAFRMAAPDDGGDRPVGAVVEWRESARRQ